MTTSAYMPDVKVEIAFNAGYSTPAASRVWTDVSQWAELTEKLTIVHGRSDENANADPNRLTMTLDNSDGRFTAGRAASPYYPNVKIGRPIRVTATPVGGVASTRFLGYVEEWPVEWTKDVDAYAAATITALSRMARLGFGAELGATDVVTGEFLAAQPRAYYPLTDEAGSTSVADATGQSDPLTIKNSGLDGTLTFGTAHGPGGSNAVEMAGSSSPLEDSPHLNAAMPLGTGDASFECFLRYDTLSTLAVSRAIELHAPGGRGLYLEVGNGEVRLRYDSADLGLTVLASPDPSNATVHHIRGQVTFSGSNATLELFVDGVSEGTHTNPGTPATIDQLNVGPAGPDTPTIALSHVAVNLSATDLAERAALVNGFDTEPAADRIARYARWGGVPAAEYAGDSDTHDVGKLSTSGKTAIAAMHEVEATESGVLFDARDNTLTFHSRARRYSASSAFTLDVLAQQVEADIAPKLDRSNLVNDVTATADDGTTRRYFDQASIDEYGYARQQIDIASTADDAEAAAGARVNRYSQPSSRIPALSVNAIALAASGLSSKLAAIMAADVDTRMTLTNMPAQAPQSQLDFFIEGYTEVIGHESYAFTLNVSSAVGFDVWTIEDPVLGQYDAYPIAY